MSDNVDVKNETSPEEYWAQIADEIGEPVRVYALGRVVNHDRITQPGALARKADWGLVFLTDTTLYIDRSSTPNWFQRLMTPGKGGSEDERTSIPLDSISKVVVPPPQGPLRRLLTGPEVGVDIFVDGGTGFHILLDRRGTKDQQVIARLTALKNA